MSENKDNGREETKILAYKGKPLVRKNNFICFGDVKSDKYVMMLELKEPRQEKGLDVAGKVLIAIKNTEDDTVVKYSEKDSLYEAFEIGEIWLDSYLKQG